MFESFSVRQLVKISGHSEAKLKRIKNYWLDKTPDETFAYETYDYLIYDGTYFHKNGCLISFMGAQCQKIIASIYAKKEGYRTVRPWLIHLKEKGLNPRYITMDGEQGVMRAINEIWPDVKIQRCLYHIQSQGMAWLRTYPKTQAGRELRCLLSTVCSLYTFKERDEFIYNFNRWWEQHSHFIAQLPTHHAVFDDLKRTVSLIKNALPNMFHYLTDEHIHKTSNALEGFYSRLKSDYRRHRGLTEERKLKYLKWYCHFKNGLN